MIIKGVHGFMNEKRKPNKMIRLILISNFLLIFSSCSYKNLLKYKHKKNYQEKSVIKSDSKLKLYQNVCYGRPNTADAGFCYKLKLTFLDSINAKNKRILNIEKDTLIIKCSYDKSSAWFYGSDKNKITGQIEIIKWGLNEIILKENIIITDSDWKERNKFKGTRSFKRTEGSGE